jgi:hypothetical protein
VTLSIGISQRAANLLFQYGDPRCTLVVSVVDNGTTTAAADNRGHAAAITVSAVAAKIPVTVDVP